MAPLTLPPISSFDSAALRSGRTEGTSGAGRADAGDSFAEALGKAVGDVEKLQVGADRSAEQVALGGGNLHETALAMEKADVAMRLAMKVRNKLVDAYQDIMRMSV